MSSSAPRSSGSSLFRSQPDISPPVGRDLRWLHAHLPTRRRQHRKSGAKTPICDSSSTQFSGYHVKQVGSSGRSHGGGRYRPQPALFGRSSRVDSRLSRPSEDCEGCPALAGVRNLGLDDPSAGRPVLHCNFGGALSALSVDTGFSCVADSDLSGQVRRFASDESAASSRQSVGCGCLLGPVATAVNRLYSNSASSMYQRVLVVVSNAISDREHVMRSPTPSLPAT